jgi:hypothetical protein
MFVLYPRTCLFIFLYFTSVASVQSRLLIYDKEADFEALLYELPINSTYYDTEEELFGVYSEDAVVKDVGIWRYRGEDNGYNGTLRIRPASTEPLWEQGDQVQALVRYMSNRNLICWGADAPITVSPNTVKDSLVNWKTVIFPNARSWVTLCITLHVYIHGAQIFNWDIV